MKNNKTNTIFSAVIVILIIIIISLLVSRKHRDDNDNSLNQPENQQSITDTNTTKSKKPTKSSVKSEQTPASVAGTNTMPTSKTIDLTDKNNADQITVKKGDIISITLKNQGDSGYKFENPEFDTPALVFKESYHTGPTPSAIGTSTDFGTDTWKFVATNNGVSTIKIKIQRISDSTSEALYFNTKVTVE